MTLNSNQLLSIFSLHPTLQGSFPDQVRVETQPFDVGIQKISLSIFKADSQVKLMEPDTKGCPAKDVIKSCIERITKEEVYRSFLEGVVSFEREVLKIFPDMSSCLEDLRKLRRVARGELTSESLPAFSNRFEEILQKHIVRGSLSQKPL
jgi:hypothetical protein